MTNDYVPARIKTNYEDSNTKANATAAYKMTHVTDFSGAFNITFSSKEILSCSVYMLSIIQRGSHAVKSSFATSHIL